MINGYPSNWHEWLAVAAILASFLAIFGNLLVAITRRLTGNHDTQKKPYNDDQNTANVEQILVFFLVMFLTYFTLKNAGIHWLTAGILAGIICAYYLGFIWNHTTGITAKPKNTLFAFAASAVFPAFLMLLGLPFVLGNLLFWALFPWTQRYFFERENVPKIPPPKDVDVDQA